VVGERALGIALMALALPGRPAYADQTLLVADNGTVRCEASAKDLTRISLKDDQFASVSKVQAPNPADDFQVVNEPLRGDIYLSVANGFSKPTISFFGRPAKASSTNSSAPSAAGCAAGVHRQCRCRASAPRRRAWPAGLSPRMPRRV
jgi:conjugal transfer pilus assembly protein TraK